MEQQFKMDPMMRAIKAMHQSGAGLENLSKEELEKKRTSVELFSKLAATSIGTKTEKIQIGNIEAEWVRPDHIHDTRHVILYCHGGGYITGGLSYAHILASKLVHHTGLPVLSYAYRLAPEHTYPAAFDDTMQVWDYLMHHGYGAANVFVAGDSAGGNLALELCLKLKQDARILPRGVVLFSPWTDMSATLSSYATWKETDPLLTYEYVLMVRDAYAGNVDYTDPKYSPLYGDLAGMPPMLIQVGSHEILRSDSEMLAQKLQENNSHAILQVYRGGWHVFQQMPIPKATQAMEQAGVFIHNLIR